MKKILIGIIGLGLLFAAVSIVSDRKTSDRMPLVIHNIGRGAQEENILFQFEIIGHYRTILINKKERTKIGNR